VRASYLSSAGYQNGLERNAAEAARIHTSLPIFGRAIALCTCLPLAPEPAVLGVAEPRLALVVVDVAPGVDPHGSGAN
jgi:hypothetical protein